ncbi:MAG: hypothetical protein AAB911_01365 [Patescibacteria group bacterium]
MAKYPKTLKLFLKNIFLFWLPLVIIFFILEAVIFYSGELLPIKRVISLQTKSRQDILFGRKIADQSLRTYKYLTILSKKPDVLVLGSSRVMQIRQEMFDDSEKFYNAGGLIHNIADLIDFIKLLPDEAKPKTIILGVDFYWLGEKNDLIYGLSEDLSKKEEAYQWKAHLYVARYLFLQIAKNPIYIFKKVVDEQEPIESKSAIGLNALLFGDGFRSDGSYQYGHNIQEMANEIKFIDGEKVLDRINNGTDPFEQGSFFSEDRFNLLAEFLEISKKKGIKVVGLATPFSSEVIKELKSSVYQRDLFNNFQARIPLLFDEFGFQFFDYSDLASLGLNDLYMFDGMHSTEVTMGKILFNISNFLEWNTKNDYYKLNPDFLTKLNDKKTTSIQISW